METEMTELLSEISEAVGGLSDLRYGRFSKSGGASDQISEEVLATLRRLEAACEDVVEK
jgi:centromere-localized protein 2